VKGKVEGRDAETQKGLGFLSKSEKQRPVIIRSCYRWS